MRTIAVQTPRGEITYLSVADDTSIFAGDLLTIGSDGHVRRANQLTELPTADRAVVGRALISISAIDRSKSQKLADAIVEASQKQKSQVEVVRRNPRYLPATLTVARLEVGDVVEERAGVTTRSVLLSKIERPDNAFKLTFRRLGDDAFRSVIWRGHVPIDVVADAELHQGDPDRYMTERFRLDQEARKKRRDDPRALPEWQEKEVIQDVVDVGMPTPGDSVRVISRGPHYGSEGVIERVRHLSMGGEAIVFLDIVVRTLQGELRVAVDATSVRRI